MGEDDFTGQLEHDDGGDGGGGGGGGSGVGSLLHGAFFASSPREQFLRLSPCSSLVVEPVSSSTAVTYEETKRRTETVSRVPLKMGYVDDNKTIIAKGNELYINR